MGNMFAGYFGLERDTDGGGARFALHAAPVWSRGGVIRAFFPYTYRHAEGHAWEGYLSIGRRFASIQLTVMWLDLSCTI